MLTKPANKIDGLHEIAPDYDGILCDVWGVLHNGVAAWPGAVDALTQFRKQGGTVVMITNSPRRKASVVDQLHDIGVPDGVFDDVVTSGDVTRKLISEVESEVFHIGPDRDLHLFEGLGVKLVELEQAKSVVCTGLNDDRSETPEDYENLLKQILEMELPFICANPDIVVEFGDRLLWCAGAIARDYAEIGGDTHIAGKPHNPIYEAAISRLGKAAGKEIPENRILAIGDGMPTDVAGAQDFGLDLLYVSAGIHAADYGDAEDPDIARLQEFLDRHGARPVAWMPRLKR
ncbi:MAG: TIGR01459 family HAD-type hydrolase [Rhizobiaceae bacterium]